MKPASYNPRIIGQEALQKLEQSITELGVLKPIIVGVDQTIIAGHQRTKTMLKLGIKTAPAFEIADVNITDEIAFNQMHNAADIERSDNSFRVKIHGDLPEEEWAMVAPDQIEIVGMGTGALINQQLGYLLLRYGPFGAAVVNSAGDVLVSPNYARISKMLGHHLLVYHVSPQKEQKCIQYFDLKYGKFHYDHLPKNTYVQAHAQPVRLRKKGKEEQEQSMWSTLIWKYITKDMRILDFGAGQKDNAEYLMNKGYQIDALEFFYRGKSKGTKILKSAVERDIDRLIHTLKTYGRYDVVICDAVVNSVDSDEAFRSVLGCVNAFCKPGGRIYLSGRSREAAEKMMHDSKKSYSTQNQVYYFDDKGYSVIFMYGDWFYQLFHTIPEIKAMGTGFIGEEYCMADTDGRPLKEHAPSGLWRLYGDKKKELDWETVQASLRFEFTLPLPSGDRYARDNDVIGVMKKFYE